MAKYIDAEYVINGIRRRAEQFSLNETVKFAIDSTIKLLEEIPAVDVVEVKHGEWVKERHYHASLDDGYFELYHCSECNTSFANNRANFCPGCGAKMDGGKVRYYEYNK